MLKPDHVVQALHALELDSYVPVAKRAAEESSKVRRSTPRQHRSRRLAAVLCAGAEEKEAQAGGERLVAGGAARRAEPTDRKRQGMECWQKQWRCLARPTKPEDPPETRALMFAACRSTSRFCRVCADARPEARVLGSMKPQRTRGMKLCTRGTKPWLSPLSNFL